MALSFLSLFFPSSKLFVGDRFALCILTIWSPVLLAIAVFNLYRQYIRSQLIKKHGKNSVSRAFGDSESHTLVSGYQKYSGLQISVIGNIIWGIWLIVFPTCFFLTILILQCVFWEILDINDWVEVTENMTLDEAVSKKRNDLQMTGILFTFLGFLALNLLCTLQKPIRTFFYLPSRISDADFIKVSPGFTGSDKSLKSSWRALRQVNILNVEISHAPANLVSSNKSMTTPPNTATSGRITDFPNLQSGVRSPSVIVRNITLNGVSYRYSSERGFIPTQWLVTPIRQCLDRLNHAKPSRQTHGYELPLDGHDFLRDTITDEMSFLGGFSVLEVRQSEILHGRNKVSVPKPSKLSALMSEFLSPKYLRLFFFAMLLLWNQILEEMLIWVAVISAIGVYTALNVHYKRDKTVFEKTSLDMNSGRKETVQVYRSGTWTNISAEALVVGDLVLISRGMTVPADMILVSGRCICDESLSTGEAKPVAKSEASPNEEDIPDGVSKGILEGAAAVFASHYMLYSGTTVSQISSNGPVNGRSVYGTVGSVVGIGGRSTLGRILTPILESEVGASELDLGEDTYYFYGILMGFGATLTMGMIIWQVVSTKSGKGMDDYISILTTQMDAFSPMLGGALTSNAVSYALRLGKEPNGADTANNRALALVGRTEICVWDKTGALTEPGMTIVSIMTITPGRYPTFSECFDPHLSGRMKLDVLASLVGAHLGVKERNNNLHYGLANELIDALCLCHNLTPFGNELIGPPLDLALVKILNPSIYEERNGKVISFNGTSWDVLRSLEFSHNNYSSGTICRKQEENAPTMMFIKGAPEKILNLLDRNTVPYNYLEEVKALSGKANYVLSICSRVLDGSSGFNASATRDDLETPNSCKFLGFLIFQNKIREESQSVLEFLHEGGCRSVICTGDHLLAGVAAAKSLGLFNVEKKSHGELRSLVKRPKAILIGDVGTASGIVEESHHDQILWQDSETEVVHSHGDVLKNAKSYFFCVSEKAFRLLVQDDDFDIFADQIVVYGRMSPRDKARLVTLLRNPTSFKALSPQPEDFHSDTGDKSGKTDVVFRVWNNTTQWLTRGKRDSKDICVTMIGDGPNDAMAHSAASAGIAVGSHVPMNAKLAASFTCHQDTLECVKTIFRYGRATHASAYTLFMLFVFYSFGVVLFNFPLKFIDGSLNIPSFIFYLFLIQIIFNSVLSQGRPTDFLSGTRLPNSMLDVRILSRIAVLAVLFLSTAIVISLILIQSYFYVPWRFDWFAMPSPINSTVMASNMSHNYWAPLITFYVFATSIASGVIAASSNHKNIRPIFANKPLLLFLAFMSLFLGFLYLGTPNRLGCNLSINCDLQTMARIKNPDFLKNPAVTKMDQVFMGPQFLQYDIEVASEIKLPSALDSRINEKLFEDMTESERQQQYEKKPFFRKIVDQLLRLKNEEISSIPIEAFSAPDNKLVDGHTVGGCTFPHNCYSTTFGIILLCAPVFVISMGLVIFRLLERFERNRLST